MFRALLFVLITKKKKVSILYCLYLCMVYSYEILDKRGTALEGRGIMKFMKLHQVQWMTSNFGTWSNVLKKLWTIIMPQELRKQRQNDNRSPRDGAISGDCISRPFLARRMENRMKMTMNQISAIGIQVMKDIEEEVHMGTMNMRLMLINWKLILLISMGISTKKNSQIGL